MDAFFVYCCVGIAHALNMQRVECIIHSKMQLKICGNRGERRDKTKTKRTIRKKSSFDIHATIKRAINFFLQFLCHQQPQQRRRR